MKFVDIEPEVIKDQIALLKSRDHNFEGMHLFGSHEHRYSLGAPISEEELAKIESAEGIQLPKDYREFITQIACGPGNTEPAVGFAAGPWCGLIDLRDSLELPHGVLKQNFPFKKAMEWTQLPPEFQNEVALPGALIISLVASQRSVRLLLVVSGAEHGYLWVDDRINGNGIFPYGENADDYMENKNLRSTFAQWYLNWLSESLERSKDFVRD